MATRDEVKRLVAVFVAAYPNYNPGDLGAALDTWTMIVGHIPGPELLAAAAALIAQPGRAFAPAPGEIIGQWIANANRAAGVPSAAEGWQMVVERRPRKYMVYCPEAQRLAAEAEAEPARYWRHLAAYATHVSDCPECGWRYEAAELPAVVERVARMLGWPDTFPTPDNMDVCRAHWTRAYNEELQRATAQAGEPPSVTKAVAAMKPAAAIMQLAERMGTNGR
jgi:hypothetical protein